MDRIKGFKTVGFGLLLVVAPPALTYLAGLDWTKLIGPNAAMVVSGIIVILLRYVTTTPIGQGQDGNTPAPPKATP